MANVRLRSNGFFEGHFQIAGKRRWFQLHTKDRGEAQRLIDEIEATHLDGVQESTGLERDIVQFLESRRKEGRYSKASLRTRGPVLRRFGEDFNWANTNRISATAVQRWYDGLRSQMTESSALTYLLVVRAFFGWCVRKGIVAVNPIKRVVTARVTLQTRNRFCTPQERDFLIAHAPDDSLRFVLYCGFHAGMRRNEIVEARPEWFDLDAGLLHLAATDTFTPKTRKPRTIPLSTAFLEFLRGYGLRSPFMLHPESTHGRSIYRYDFRRPFTIYVRSVEMDWVKPHLMRRTFASILASRDVSIHKVAAWLGDSVLTTERHYARLIPKDQTIDRML